MPAVTMTTPSLRTRVSSCDGVDPIATRIPNSRVRALTENANTPPTPTAAMSSAMPPNAENTNAFNRSGVSTSARTTQGFRL